MPFIVAGWLASLAGVELSHQSARRRRRDLAVLRALGADRRWVTSVLYWQVTVHATAVAALAVPLGVVGRPARVPAYIDQIGARSDLSVPYATFGFIVVGLVLGSVAAAVPARRARRNPCRQDPHRRVSESMPHL